MKVAVCACCRLENLYLRHWVEYYKNLGVDNIILFDNNFENEDNVLDVIGDYVSSGYVYLYNCSGLRNFQLGAYNLCIQEYNDKFDWIAFFDIDEFLTLKKDNDIKEYLSRFENNDEVDVNWMIYDDNDLIYYDNRPVTERFTRPMKIEKHIGYEFPENFHIKSILHVSKNPNLRFLYSPHSPNFSTSGVYNNGTPKVDNDGNYLDGYPFNNELNYDYAYLRHYIQKTIQEYLSFKFFRGTPDRSDEQNKLVHTIERFFLYNEKTPEKEEFIKNFINDNANNNIKDNNINII